MSVTVEISEHQLKFAMFKIALAMASLVAILAVGLTLFQNVGQIIAVSALLVCMAFYFLANGFLIILKIIDWFEARARRHD